MSDVLVCSSYSFSFKQTRMEIKNKYSLTTHSKVLENIAFVRPNNVPIYSWEVCVPMIYTIIFLGGVEIILCIFFHFFLIYSICSISSLTSGDIKFTDSEKKIN